jgi:flavin-binding protein dodecin
MNSTGELNVHIIASVEFQTKEFTHKTYMNQCLDDSVMVYKYIDIVGTSNTVITDAINNAFQEASRTVKNIKWGELGRVTFRVEEGKKIEYQAEVRIGFEVIKDNED